MFGCRPIIDLDGCFLQARFVGQLLSIIGRDGKDNAFLIAIAIIMQENKDSWSWFLWLFVEHINKPDDIGLVFISDR